MALISYSVDVVLSKSLCYFRFTIVADSNLAMSKTILILVSIDTDILSEIHSTKFQTNTTSNYERIIEIV